MGNRRQIYFDKTVHIQSCKDVLKGDGEWKLAEILDGLGLKEGVDYAWQHPVADTYVADFALLREGLIIEFDEVKIHKKTKEIDNKRDLCFLANGWEVLRITDKQIDSSPLFFKYLIMDYINDKRLYFDPDSVICQIEE